MDPEQLRKVVLTAVLVLGAFVIVMGLRSVLPTLSEPPSTDQTSRITERTSPLGVQVPDMNSQVPAGVAKPTLLTAAAPDSPTSFRKFEMEIRNNEFVPNTVIVREGDTVRIDLVAIDRNYDFYLPYYALRQRIDKQQKRGVEFQALESGTFAFFCERCGGPSTGPVGKLIVVQ